MDYRGHTAVLSAILVLVGMMFLVPAITEKALAVIHATAKGVCGPEGQTRPCEFVYTGARLSASELGAWVSNPTHSGTFVTWSTTGGGWDEKGFVKYNVSGPTGQKEMAVLSFENPLVGSNKCGITGIGGDCTAGKGQIAEFTYNLRGK
jgi:hypothetical protein